MKRSDFTEKLFLIFTVTLLYLPAGLRAELPEQVLALSKRAEAQNRIAGRIEYYKDSMGNLKIYQRDTTIYDTVGNIVMEKSSRANSDWKLDSLIRTDSSVYINGKISERYFRQYHFYEPLYNCRSVYTYSDSERVRVEIVSDWDSIANTWIAKSKDSIVCSTPFEGAFDDSTWDMFYPNFISSYAFDFDKQSSSWKISSVLVKSVSECDSITLVVNGTSYYQNGASGAFKRVAIFKTPDWSWYNRTTYTMIEQRPGTDALFEYYKMEISETGAKYYRASSNDSSSQFYLEVYGFKDSYGNDTLVYARNLDTISMTWDTTPSRRYERTYDSDGNNTGILEYYFSKSKGWELSNKVTYTYENPGTVLIIKKMPKSLQKFSKVITPSMIKFYADNLIKLKLYTLSGGLITSVTQQPASSITLQYNQMGKFLACGTYLAEVISQDGMYRTCLAIQR